MKATKHKRSSDGNAARFGMPAPNLLFVLITPLVHLGWLLDEEQLRLLYDRLLEAAYIGAECTYDEFRNHFKGQATRAIRWLGTRGEMAMMLEKLMWHDIIQRRHGYTQLLREHFCDIAGRRFKAGGNFRSSKARERFRPNPAFNEFMSKLLRALKGKAF